LMSKVHNWRVFFFFSADFEFLDHRRHMSIHRRAGSLMQQTRSKSDQQMQSYRQYFTPVHRFSYLAR
jgi:hypothetical protein